MRSLKNTVLKTMAALNGASVIFCGSCLDNPDPIFCKVLIVNITWLACFFWVNRDYFKRKYE